MKETRVVTAYLTSLMRKILSSAIVGVLVFSLGSTFANAQACLSGPNLILDGGFEIGPPPPPDPGWPLWPIQSSTLFPGESPICTTTLCVGLGVTAPRTGTSWIWFGGNQGFEELAQVGQTVNVASTSVATLRFWMRFQEVGDPDLDDTINIRVDGNIVATFTEPAVDEAAYSERIVNFVLAPGSHTIVFEFDSPDDLTFPFASTNIGIDDISLNACVATAATASISGRVLLPNGRGMANTSVTLTDQAGVTLTARTNAFGFYRFDDVRVGPSYVLQVAGGRYSFSSQVVTLDGDLEGVNFVAGR